jgi:hypothetical protein
MIFAFFEEIDGPSGRASRRGTGVGEGSFSAVARERELSQAAVARQISQLEDHFGLRRRHRRFPFWLTWTVALSNAATETRQFNRCPAPGPKSKLGRRLLNLHRALGLRPRSI